LLTSIATVSISGTLEAKLKAVAKAGFGGVEIFENDLLSYPGSPGDIGRLIRDLGMVCTVFQPFRDFEGMPGELRRRTFDRAERKFDVMEELGTQLVLVCSNCSPHALGDRNRLLDDFAELAGRAAARNLRIGYEALAWGRFVNDHRDAWSIVRDVDHPALGLIFDSFHSLVRGIPSSSIGDVDPAKLFLVQIADAPRLDMDYLSWSRHFRNMPGQGDLPVAEFAAEIFRLGFDGYWSLEIFNDRFRAAPAQGVALDGFRSLLAMRDEVARLPRAPIEPTLPPRVRVGRVTFIEFAANDVEAEALGAMLTALGFRAIERHRSKAVERWRQGDVNLIVNREPEGFAHSFDMAHGASVCAIAISVDDVDSAMARAAALSIQSFTQPVAPGEMQIPSVRGVGGSLIYFIETGTEPAVWEADFRPIPGAPDEVEGIGLKAVDYIAQTMFYDEFLSWLLYYLALFDVGKTPQVEVADPHGLVLSQAIESPDRQFRITLSGSTARETLSTRFVTNYMGAGVQHLAFATDDVFAAAERARANGLELLEIPRNYYDDLEARFGLAADLVDRMAALNILYDREGDAEYFHVYSRAYEKRIFFEIVERRGYEGYGTANAAIRLAAQSRFRPDVMA
jgi:4-hydroxyphenylpyruvate dioxygenase